MTPPRLSLKRSLPALLVAVSMLSTAASAQQSRSSLNLNLPSGNLPSVAPASASSSQHAAQSATVDKTTSASTAKTSAGAYYGDHSNSTASPDKSKDVRSGVPGVYYGDHSNTTDASVAARNTPTCDDSTYNNTQMHGSVDMGVVSGSHMGTGSYTGGTVTLSKAFGDCEHPTGGVSISIGGTQFNGGHGGHW